ncbi:MAG TPA: hypothetical protein VFP76_03495 [Gemmatimonadota bacterium]|nr:hypothetical protein [Gemmatimonadota bacterium]
MKRGLSPLLAVAACAGLAAGCAAPISTQRSPMHLRIVELRNDTGTDWILTIEPTADQHLGAATTFTGRLRPGETKTLYLYHGFRYRVDVLQDDGDSRASAEYEVDRDMELVFAGDSLHQASRLAVELGEPTTTFSDSAPVLDPFGLRSTDRPIQPDTTNMRDRRERQRNDPQGGRGGRPNQL